MRKTKVFIAISLFSSIATLSTAHAALLQFNITGSFTSSFQIDASQRPDRTNVQSIGPITQIFYDNRNLVFNGTPRIGSISFGTGLASAFQITAPGVPFTQLTGPALFSGPVNAPIFNIGSFALRNPFLGQSVTINISELRTAVPEPGTLALFATGLGLLGAGAYRRQKSQKKQVEA